MHEKNNFDDMMPLVVAPLNEYLNARMFKNLHFKRCGNAGAYTYSVVETGFSTIVTLKCVVCGETVELKWSEV